MNMLVDYLPEEQTVSDKGEANVVESEESPLEEEVSVEGFVGAFLA